MIVNDISNTDLKYKKENWKKRPMAIKKWDYNMCDYVMFIDENNTSSAVEKIKKAVINGGKITKDDRFFTITGCIFTKNSYRNAKNRFDKIRNAYWKNGKWYNPKEKYYIPVCFHSIDIRNRKYAFKLDDKYNTFIKEFDEAINDTDYTIISITIDLVEYVLHTSYDIDVYDIAFDFILERFIYHIKNKKGMIMLESRGKVEDKLLLSHIVQKMDNGLKFINKRQIEKNIIGIFFNQKFNSLTDVPILGLEIADISSYPIHKFIKYGKKDLAFYTLEKKIRNYPNYDGRGLKIYPKVSNDYQDIIFEGLVNQR